VIGYQPNRNMTCCQRQSSRKTKKYRRRNSVYPQNEIESPPEFSANEKMECGGCHEYFDLGSNELKIHCNLCNQFFHCKIAGECLGNSCRIVRRDGTIHRASYCFDCVGLLTYKKILCKDCFNETHLKNEL